MLSLLAKVYPEHDWEATPKSVTASGKKSQFLLKSALKALFPKEGSLSFESKIILFTEILDEYKHPDIVSPSGRNLELDFFYPRLNIAFEYQVFQDSCDNNI
jgi:hypothetical protein